MHQTISKMTYASLVQTMIAGAVLLLLHPMHAKAFQPQTQTSSPVVRVQQSPEWQGVVHGRVLLEADLRPVPDAVVTLFRVVDGQTVAGEVGSADGTGAFTIQTTTPGQYLLRAYAWRSSFSHPKVIERELFTLNAGHQSVGPIEVMFPEEKPHQKDKLRLDFQVSFKDKQPYRLMLQHENTLCVPLPIQPDGTYKKYNMAPGTYDLLWFSPDGVRFARRTQIKITQTEPAHLGQLAPPPSGALMLVFPHETSNAGGVLRLTMKDQFHNQVVKPIPFKGDVIIDELPLGELTLAIDEQSPFEDARPQAPMIKQGVVKVNITRNQVTKIQVDVHQTASFRGEIPAGIHVQRFFLRGPTELTYRLDENEHDPRIEILQNGKGRPQAVQLSKLKAGEYTLQMVFLDQKGDTQYTHVEPFTLEAGRQLKLKMDPMQDYR